MALPNTTLLSSTQGLLNLTGQPVRAGGAGRSVGSLFTVAITAANFRGRVFIEGTLAANPAEEDWFAVVLPDQQHPYVEYLPATSGVKGFTFKGNFTWLRARIDRSHLAQGSQTQQQIAAFGYLDSIVLNRGAWEADQNLPSALSLSGGLDSVRGNNLGSDVGLYAGSVGQSNVLLNFKTIRAGAGITLSSDAQTITITGTGGGTTQPTASLFTDLSDVPQTIAQGDLLFGDAYGGLTALAAPSANDVVLTKTAAGMKWLSPVTKNTLEVRDEGTKVSDAGVLNFTGRSVAVSSQNGVTNIAIESAATADLEYVMLTYTAGNSGNLSSVDVIHSKSAGVTATIVDPINCIVAFTFAGRSFPPSAIALLGQAYATNEFNYTNVTPVVQTRKVKSGGTAAAPTLMGEFTGPITLQLRMADTGASAGAGLRAKVAVQFRF